VDLMFGGGLCHYLPNTTKTSCRADSVDLYTTAIESGWDFQSDRASFEALHNDSATPIMRLFSLDHMDYEIDREASQQPSLAEMASKALGILSKSDKGFFLMIEGSRIDMAAHDNDPGTHVREILAYNDAIQVVKNFISQGSEGESVMISVSDHETGGVSVGRQVGSDYPEYLWHPEVLQRVRNSSERIGRALHAAVKSGSTKLLKSIIEDDAGINDYTKAELDALNDPIISAGSRASLISDMVSRRALIGWSSHGHSAVDVNLYAYGEKSELLRGNHENTDIGGFIRDYLGIGQQLVDCDDKIKKGWKARVEKKSGRDDDNIVHYHHRPHRRR